jgi:recombination protein RecR
MNNDIQKLAELFEAFPGIGKRQAKRFVYFLLHKNPSYIAELTAGISKIKQDIDQCQGCFRFFPKTGERSCDICKRNNDTKQLLVVEKDADLETLDKTHIYEGKYFVLGGFIQTNEKKRSFARTSELIARIERDIKNDMLSELIFGLSVSPEAEHTRLRLHTMLREKFPDLKFSTLGRGLSTGTELEYSDVETLKYALESRIEQ